MDAEEIHESISIDTLNGLSDADEGLAAILASLSTRHRGRFKAPIASIELLQDVVGLDVLDTGNKISCRDLYKIVYVLDRGPSALLHLMKAQELLKILNRLDEGDREKCLREIAEAEATLVIEATEYYNKNFADADQIALANELIESINRVYLMFSDIKPKPKKEVKKNDTKVPGLWAWLKRWLPNTASA